MEADGDAHLANRMEMRARFLEQGVGHDALVHRPAFRRIEVDLITQALVLAGAGLDVTHGPAVGHLLEAEIFIHSL